jgi:hypothetical protein
MGSTYIIKVSVSKKFSNVAFAGKHVGMGFCNSKDT